MTTVKLAAVPSACIPQTAGSPFGHQRQPEQSGEASSLWFNSPVHQPVGVQSASISSDSRRSLHRDPEPEFVDINERNQAVEDICRRTTTSHRQPAEPPRHATTSMLGTV